MRVKTASWLFFDLTAFFALKETPEKQKICLARSVAPCVCTSDGLKKRTHRCTLFYRHLITVND